MPEINLGLAVGLLDKLRYNTGVARGSLTPQGTKAPDPVLGWFSRDNYKAATMAFNGGGWTSSSLDPAKAEFAYPQVNFQQSQYTTTTNNLTEQEKAIGENTTGVFKPTRYQAILDTYMPGRYRDEPNVGPRRGGAGEAFGLVIWNDTTVVTEQVSSKFWRVALSDIGESDILEELAVVYFTTVNSCFTYNGELLPAFEAVLNSGFLDRGGTVVVNSEWGPTCAARGTFLTTDVNNTFGTSMIDLSTLIPPFGEPVRVLTHPPLISPFRTQKTDATTAFTGGTPIYTHEGQAIVAYQDVSQGKVVRVGDSNLNGGHPEFFDGDLDPRAGETLVASFGTGLLAWTLGVSYEEIGDIRVD